MDNNPIDDMEYQFGKLQETCIEQQKRIKQLEAENKSEYKRGLEIGKKILEDKVIAENQRLREAVEETLRIFESHKLFKWQRRIVKILQDAIPPF